MRPLLILATALTLLLPAQARAGSLQVTPVSVDLNQSRRTATLTLGNTGDAAIDVQVRVFRWTIVDGVERLEPTDEVVASPPAGRLAPGATQLIRIVRVSDRPAPLEESYRVLVDELPDLSRVQAGEVSLLIRQSIPIFFASRPAKSVEVSWRMERTAQGHQLVALNASKRRLRVADVELRRPDGSVVFGRAGLAGYVLAGAEMRWPLADKSAAEGESLSLTASSDVGPLSVVLDPPS